MTQIPDPHAQDATRAETVRQMYELALQAKCPDGFEKPSVWEIVAHLYDHGLRLAAQPPGAGERETMVVESIRGCARCGGEHEAVTVRRFLDPPDFSNGWALCPTTGDPILFTVSAWPVPASGGSTEPPPQPPDVDQFHPLSDVGPDDARCPGCGQFHPAHLDCEGHPLAAPDPSGSESRKHFDYTQAGGSTEPKGAGVDKEGSGGGDASGEQAPATSSPASGREAPVDGTEPPSNPAAPLREGDIAAIRTFACGHLNDAWRVVCTVCGKLDEKLSPFIVPMSGGSTEPPQNEVGRAGVERDQRECSGAPQSTEPYPVSPAPHVASEAPEPPVIDLTKVVVEHLKNVKRAQAAPEPSAPAPCPICQERRPAHAPRQHVHTVLSALVMGRYTERLANMEVQRIIDAQLRLEPCAGRAGAPRKEES